MRLRVMTYNIRHGYGVDGRTSLARVGGVIAVAQPALVALQEVDQIVWRSGFMPQSKWLGKKLRMHHAFGPNVHFFRLMAYGNTILSDLPFLEVHNHHLPGWGERRGLLIARRSDVVIGCTHLGLDAALRAEQVKAILTILQPYAYRYPLILAGDFNCRRDDPELSTLPELLQDTAWDDKPYTYPAGRPEAKIDYIFVDYRVTCLGVWTVDSPASDHLALCAELEFNGKG